MDILFVMDPLGSINPSADTTFDLMAAAERRGHQVWWCEQSALGITDAHVVARAERVNLLPQKTPHYSPLQTRELVLTEIGATFMRKDPPVDVGYLHAALLLHMAHEHGAHVYNRPSSLLSANEKLYALNFPAWTPETVVTTSIAEVRRFAEQAGNIVLKPLDGNGGRAVFRSHKGDSNLAPLVEAISFGGRLAIMAQRYLPAVDRGDKRIILVDGEPQGAVNRVAQPGEHRSNLHVGGRAEAATLTQREIELCAALAPALRRDGLLFVGIDVIGGFLTEVNVTSPTGVQEIRALSGIDISPRVIEAIEARSSS